MKAPALCAKCNGNKKIYIGKSQWIKCDGCNGVGFILYDIAGGVFMDMGIVDNESIAVGTFHRVPLIQGLFRGDLTFGRNQDRFV